MNSLILPTLQSSHWMMEILVTQKGQKSIGGLIQILSYLCCVKAKLQFFWFFLITVYICHIIYMCVRAFSGQKKSTLSSCSSAVISSKQILSIRVDFVICGVFCYPAASLRHMSSLEFPNREDCRNPHA